MTCERCRAVYKSFIPNNLRQRSLLSPAFTMTMVDLGFSMRQSDIHTADLRMAQGRSQTIILRARRSAPQTIYKFTISVS